MRERRNRRWGRRSWVLGWWSNNGGEGGRTQPANGANSNGLGLETTTTRFHSKEHFGNGVCINNSIFILENDVYPPKTIERRHLICGYNTITSTCLSFNRNPSWASLPPPSRLRLRGRLGEHEPDRACGLLRAALWRVINRRGIEYHRKNAQIRIFGPC